MLRPATVLFAILLVPAASACAAAQTQGAGASPSVRSSEPPPPLPRGQRVFTGVQLRFSGSGDANGVITPNYPVVRAVHPDSPGQQAGLREGDVIIEINGQDSRADRATWWELGVRYTLRIRRGEEEREVVLVPLPPRDAPAVSPSS